MNRLIYSPLDSTFAEVCICIPAWFGLQDCRIADSIPSVECGLEVPIQKSLKISCSSVSLFMAKCVMDIELVKFRGEVPSA